MSKGIRNSFKNVFILIIMAIGAAMLVDFSPASLRQNVPVRIHALSGLSGARKRPAAVAGLPANQLVTNYGKLPLGFEANEGQTDSRVKFVARGKGYSLFLTGDEAVLTLRSASQKAKGKSQKAKVEKPGGETRNWKLETGNSKLETGNSKLPARRSPLVNDARAGLRTTDDGQRTTDSILRMKLVGANARAAVTGGEELPGKSNYFLGNDPKKWRTNVANYAQVKYAGVYPGVDLVYHGNQGGQLEYDFVVAPGANPSAIVLDVGAVREPPTVAAVSDRRTAMGTPPLQKRAPREAPLQIAADGDLIVKIDGGEVRLRKPVVYQEKSIVDSRKLTVQNGIRNSKFVNRKSAIDHRQFVDGRFVLTASNQVRFAVGPYDHTQPLVIDPALSYSTYLGGSGTDYAYAIAVDPSGDAYVTGSTSSTDFPTSSPLQGTQHATGSENAFVAELNPAGTALVYSTYLGGSTEDYGSGIAVDSSSNAYVTGTTYSSDFPTSSPLQRACGGCSEGAGTGFVAKLNAGGATLAYSTYLGGSNGDQGSAIALDSSGSAYVTGNTSSSDFPTVNSFQSALLGEYTAFVAKLNPAGSALTYSTYLGGSNGDLGYGIAVDSSGSAYVTGNTSSTDFPSLNPLQAALLGEYTGFVSKLTPAGSALVYSTYLGGSYQDYGSGIAVDSLGNAYVTGLTYSADFPTANPIQPACGPCSVGGNTAFVSKLNPAGSALVYSTYLGGTTFDQGSGIAVDSSGDAYVTGITGSADFPTVNPFQPACGGCSQDNLTAFVAKLNPAGSALLFSSFLGGSGEDAAFGIAVDSSANIYVTGYTYSTDFPTVHAFQASNKGSGDAFVAKIMAVPAVTLATNSLTFGSQVENTTSAIQSVTLTSSGDGPLSIASIMVSGDFALATTATSCPYSGGAVPAQTTCTIDITFTPTGTGPLSGAVTITDNNNGVAGSTQTVTLSGNGTVSGVSLTPSSLAFGSQQVGISSNPLSVTLDNTGSGSLTFTALSISGDFALGAATTCATSTPVSAAGTCTLNVTFTPTATGVRNGTVTITDNASGGTQTVALSGTGTAPLVSLSVPSLSFGSESLDATTTAQAVTVNNTGTAPLTFSNIVATGDFAVAASGTTCSTSAPVATGSNCVVFVTFTPTAAGTRNGALTLTDNSNGLTNSTQTVTLSGTGTAPTATLSAPSLSFGSEPVGMTSGVQSVIVTNSTSTFLTFTNIATTGDFAVAASGTTCSTSAPVAPSGTCVINVTFSPTAAGSRTGTLTLNDNAPNSPQMVTLSGTGTQPVVSLSAPLTFSGQLVGTTSNSQTVTVTNTGNGSLTFTAIAATAPFAIAATGTTCAISSPVAAAGTCTVAVTFTPTAAGAASGSLSFTDNAPNSPQTVALSGTGQDFTLSPSSTSATVAPGSTASYTLSVGGEDGLTGTVAFTCNDTTISEATCSVSPNPATLGSSSTPVTVSVTTTAASVSAPRSRPLPPAPPLPPGLRGLWMLAMVLAAMAWAIRRRNRPGASRWQSTLLPLAAGLLLLTLGLAGCGGGGGEVSAPRRRLTPEHPPEPTR